MRIDLNVRKTPHRFVGLVRYCKILVTLDKQSAHWEAAIHNYRNRTYPYLFRTVHHRPGNINPLVEPEGTLKG